MNAILNDGKTWEIRARGTNIRGTIYLAVKTRFMGKQRLSILLQSQNNNYKIRSRNIMLKIYPLYNTVHLLFGCWKILKNTHNQSHSPEEQVRLFGVK